MKTLNKYISEWKINNQSMKNVDDDKRYFIYNHESGYIKIFDHDFAEIKNYEDKVYINGEQANIERGWTEATYKKGTYNVYIKDLEKITNCKFMFWGCDELEYVPKINNSKKIISTMGMFSKCKILKSVPLFKVTDENTLCDMFKGCDKLDKKTKQDWSEIYDFKSNYRKSV